MAKELDSFKMTSKRKCSADEAPEVLSEYEQQRAAMYGGQLCKLTGVRWGQD